MLTNNTIRSVAAIAALCVAVTYVWGIPGLLVALILIALVS